MAIQTHFKTVVAGANQWSYLQNGVIEMGVHECLHYLPVTKEARAFIEKEVPDLHHFRQRFSIAFLIGVDGVPYHTKTLRGKEPNPSQSQIGQNLD